MSLSAGAHLGAYEIVSLVGRGGMGEVYRARDTRLGRTVAIKVLAGTADGSARQRLLREARAISSLDHPNICALYDVGHQDGIDFLVMQYLDGETLAARLLRGPLPVEEALRHARDIAQALDAAHTRGIVHRDLKPSNILLSPSGARLLDFGLAAARLQDDGAPASGALVNESTHTALTAPGTVVGTLPYMAPEQFEGRPADARTDVFAFGAVLFEMLTGQRAFAADADAGVMAAIMRRTPPPPSQLRRGVPRAIDALVMRCLEKEPSARWQRFADVHAALSPRRRRVAWVPAAVAAIALATGAASLGRWLSTEGASGSGVSSAEPHAMVLAVLPLQVDSADASERAYWSGLSQAVAEKLARLPAARHVNVAASADIGARRVKTADDARLEVGATHLVRGRAARAGAGMQTTLELVEARSGRTLQTRAAVTDRRDSAAAHNAVLDAMLALLGVSPTQRDRARLLAPTAVAGAYDFYLQGLGYMRDYDRPENLESAIAVLEHALQLDPDHAPAHAGLGEAYWRKYTLDRDAKWVDLARRACERALGLDEAEAQPHLCLGVVELGTGRFEKAVQEFTHALEREPDNPYAYIRLGEAHEQLRDMARAEEAYSRALAVRPRYWLTHSAIGAFYHRSGSYDAAEAAFQRVIDLSPDSWRAYSNIGGVKLARKRPREAAPWFERSMALKANYAAASNLGTIYYGAGDYTRAAAAYEKAVGLGPTRHDLWANLGWARHRAGDTARAREAFARAAELAEAQQRVNPRDAAIVMSLAVYRARLGELDASRNLARRALELDGASARLVYNAGVLHATDYGDPARGFELMAAAVARGYPLADIESDPALSGLTAHPGFSRVRDAGRATRD